MELYDFVKLIRNKKKTIFAIVFTTIILVMAVNFVLPKKYGSELQVLIIQNNLNNTDPYLVSKSSEHLGNILTKIIYSGSFYNKVIESGFGVDESYFGKSYKDKLKKWGSIISAKNIEDTGIIKIIVSHKDRDQAELIVESIGYNLKINHKEYHGSGDNVEVKIINEPITSNFPSEPNIIVNFIGALVFSFMFSFLYIYLFPDKKYDLTLLPKRDKKAVKNTIVVKNGNEFARYYHFYLLGTSFLLALLYNVIHFKSGFQFLFLIAYVPVFKHVVLVYNNKDPKELDPELKKLALSTFLFALLFGIGLIF
jgi:capsular polysaccharide biosynthesis protein